jgi:signal transduction histidine kinase
VTSIRLFYLQQLDGITIVYEDNGVGIPVKEKSRIFERGSGLTTGFGLFFSKEILSITGITIKETGKAGSGARFEISVPWGKFRLVRETTGSQ